MKKLLVLLLALLLSISAAIPAAAESGSDAELERITQSVKTTLDLDTQEYSHFQGDYEEGELVPVWNLYWEGDAGSLSVSALSDGTITSYSLNSAETVSRPSSGVPAFPQGDPEQARKVAESFLEQVLGTGESAALEEASGLDRLDSTTYRFSGTILLNGLPSPLSCSVTTGLPITWSPVSGGMCPAALSWGISRSPMQRRPRRLRSRRCVHPVSAAGVYPA